MAVVATEPPMNKSVHRSRLRFPKWVPSDGPVNADVHWSSACRLTGEADFPGQHLISALATAFVSRTFSLRYRPSAIACFAAALPISTTDPVGRWVVRDDSRRRCALLCIRQRRRRPIRGYWRFSVSIPQVETWGYSPRPLPGPFSATLRAFVPDTGTSAQVWPWELPANGWGYLRKSGPGSF